MPTFNLIDEPWLPCVTRDGEQKDLSLRAALTQAHDVRELFDPSPLVTAALHRLLLAVVTRVNGPKNLREWEVLWGAGKFDVPLLDEYLARWRDRFDLFDAEHPFYQLAGFTAKKTTPMKRLGWEFAAGNNATLFDHSWDEERPAFAPPVAARWVVATQTFAASAGKSETLHTKDSPWSRGAVILMHGSNLFETLTLNLLSLLRHDFPAFADDRPTWELTGRWQPAHGLTPSGILDYLSWQSRAIRLLPQPDGSVRECYFAQGRALSDEWRGEPMYAYRRDAKAGLMVWQFNADRAVWRDSHALFNLSPGAPFQVPQALAHTAKLVRDGSLDRHRLYQLQILGQSLEAGQPVIQFWRQERLPFHVEYLNDASLLGELRKAVGLAEECAQVLLNGLRGLARLLVAPNSDQKGGRQPDKKDVNNIMDGFGALTHFWAMSDSPFRNLLLDLPSDRVVEDGEVSYGVREMPRWAETVRRAAVSAFGGAAGSLDQSARALKAVAKAEPQFHGRLRVALKEYLPEERGEGGQR